MYESINQDDFIQAFDNYNRSDNFSYEGRKALFKYLEYLEDDCEIKIELDIIALCCEYTEYENFKELQDNYNIESFKELENNTTVIHIPYTERFIIQNY